MRGVKPKPIDVDLAVRLYLEGKSLREVGKILGVSGVTIGSRLYKRGVERRPDGYQRPPNVPLKKSPASQVIPRRAHRMVEEAVRAGQLIPASACEHCGERVRVSAHHADYGKPLSVDWLCSPCHRKWHRENTPLYPAERQSWSELKFKRAPRK